MDIKGQVLVPTGHTLTMFILTLHYYLTDKLSFVINLSSFLSAFPVKLKWAVYINVIYNADAVYWAG